MEENTLASELARLQTMLRELEASMVDRDVPPAAREICGELLCRVDRSLRMARSWSADESPRGDGGQDTPGTGNATKDAHFKGRKRMPSVRKQVRVTSVEDEAAARDDGFSWRKYGQKDILGAKYPRAYFRCRHRHTQSCLATKQVQRADDDPLLFHVVYHGAHSCGAQARAEQQQLQPAGHAGQDQEQRSLLPATGQTAGGLHLQARLFEPMTPLPFTSTPTGTNDGCTLLSPTTSLEWQLRSSHAAAGFGAGGMELDYQFEDFFSINPPDYCFQWDCQDLYVDNC